MLPTVDATPILATPNSAAPYRHYFRRYELYTMVWASPVSEIAVGVGVSDVALANLCQRRRICASGGDSDSGLGSSGSDTEGSASN